jgi:PAS domain S-box-containing protein
MMAGGSDNLELLKQYQNVIDVGTIVSKTDSRGIITYANEEFCRISKYRRDELIGRPHNIVRHPDMSKEAFRDFWQTIRINKKPWSGVIKNRAKDGSIYYVKTTAVPILDADQNINEFIAVRSDITDVVLQQDRINRLLSASEQFVPKDFLRYLGISDISEIRPEISQRMDLTILFTDIRSFTSLSENLQPEAIFNCLNRFFTAMEPVITRNDGFIDKYPGDGIMAIFRNAFSAIVAAKEIYVELDRLNEDLARDGKSQFRIGIGVHSGSVILGTVGSQRRLDTTVIGDAVNVASRLEKATKTLGKSILLSGETLESVQKTGRDCIRCRRVGLIKVRGRSEPISAFELII